MSEIFQPIVPLIVNCKCCGIPARIWGVVDFSKGCEEHRGRKVFQPSGIPVYYHRCQNCMFIFTVAFDKFDQEDFIEHVYNDQYILTDPDYADARPRHFADLVAKLLHQTRDLRILEYGGGNGFFSRLLREAGFTHVDTYDPYVDEFSVRPDKKYDVLVSVEVVEHAVNPATTLADMDSLLDADGIIMFSTLLQPSNIDELGINWWYVAPRNGHVSLFSKDAILKLIEPFDMRFQSSRRGLHVLFRRVPPYAEHLFRMGT